MRGSWLRTTAGARAPITHATAHCAVHHTAPTLLDNAAGRRTSQEQDAGPLDRDEDLLQGVRTFSQLEPSTLAVEAKRAHEACRQIEVPHADGLPQAGSGPQRTGVVGHAVEELEANPCSRGPGSRTLSPVRPPVGSSQSQRERSRFGAKKDSSAKSTTGPVLNCCSPTEYGF